MSEAQHVDRLLHVPLRVSIGVGARTMPMREVLELGPGAVLALDRAAGEPVDVLVNERLVARGELIAVDGAYGVRITELTGTA